MANSAMSVEKSEREGFGPIDGELDIRATGHPHHKTWPSSKLALGLVCNPSQRYSRLGLVSREQDVRSASLAPVSTLRFVP
jgi:hypothetical protein